jgi:hypothetical protein
MAMAIMAGYPTSVLVNANISHLFTCGIPPCGKARVIFAMAGLRLMTDQQDARLRLGDGEGIIPSEGGQAGLGLVQLRGANE